MSNDREAEAAAYVEPLRAAQAAKQQHVEALRDELAREQGELSGLTRALVAIDPQFAATHRPNKPGPKPGGGKRSGWAGTPISAARAERARAILQSSFDGRVFDSKQAAQATGLHVTTMHKVLKVLHESGQLQLDHLGGPRKTTRYYRLPTLEGD